MAKQATETSIWDDFTEENLLSSGTEREEETEEQEEEEDETEEVEEKKLESKKKDKKKVETTEETEEEIREDEEEVKNTKKDSKTTNTSDEESEGGEADSSTFFEEVEKITGQGVEVDYGDVDPLTPQGIAIREKAVRESALDSFLEELETSHPAAYKALQHSYNGGNVADLFKVVTSRDYSNLELADTDIDLAKEILKEYYQSKGIKNEKRIKTLLESAEESEEGLVGEAKATLQELKAEQAAQTDKTLAQQKAAAEEQKKRDGLTVAAIDEVLESGKLGSFKLTGKAEAQEFKKFALTGLRRTGDGKYEFATPLNTNNLEKLLQYQYFQFKEGDLSKLIQIKAATENAQKLRLKVNAESASGKKGSGGNNNQSQVTGTLKDYDV